MRASTDTSGGDAASAARPLRLRDRLVELPKLLIGGLLLLAIANLLVGVFLRYVVVAITDYFDLPGISFFWVEEVGEFALAWLTLIGAAIGIHESSHFALGVLVHRLPGGVQRSIERINHALIAIFGALTCYFGWQLSVLNATLTSPGLQINLAWLYASAAAGGALITIYAIAVVVGVPPLRRGDHLPGS
jgi:TRAP-type C4-dicarboxylate transport system permease small subunit